MWGATIAQTINIHSKQDFGNLETGGWGLMACLLLWDQLLPRQNGRNLLKKSKLGIKNSPKATQQSPKQINLKSLKTSFIG